MNIKQMGFLKDKKCERCGGNLYLDQHEDENWMVAKCLLCTREFPLDEPLDIKEKLKIWHDMNTDARLVPTTLK